jgi:carbon storage regulator
VITVVEIRGDKVRLGIVAPKDVPVHRSEIYEAIHGRLPDQALAILGESDDRGRRARAFGILDDLRSPAVHHRNAAVGRAEVDTDNFSHGVPVSLPLRRRG